MTTLSDLLNRKYPDDSKNYPTIRVQIGPMDSRGSDLLDEISEIDSMLTVKQTKEILHTIQWYHFARYYDPLLEYVCDKGIKWSKEARDLLRYLDILATSYNLSRTDIYDVLDNAIWWLITMASIYSSSNREEPKQ